MRSFLFGSTARQVGWVVALATLSSNLMVLAVWLLLSPGSVLPGSLRAMAAEIIGIAAILQDTPPPQQAPVIAAAARQGLHITPDNQAGSTSAPDAVISRALRERLAERGLDFSALALSPTGSARQGIAVTLSPPTGPGWRVEVSAERMRDVIPSLLLPPTTIILLLGVPLLLVLLWVAHRITRPIGNLAQAAEAIDAAGHHVMLPEIGTSEIRRLARAINGLLVRLREDVAERARIMASASHDLRTPLTRLRLRVASVDDPVLRERLGADLFRMESIVGASLMLLETDLRQEPAEPLDLGSLACTVCDQFADAGHDVTYAGPQHLVIRAQPIALERALTNLLDNACTHAGSGRLTLLESSGCARLVVEDDGPGIAETDLPHITAAFQRGVRGSAGHGLGLAIVASVARAHGGHLALSNREPHGLRVELSLPLAVAP